MIVVGDDDAARTVVLDLVAGIPDLRAFDGGSLVNAVGIEAFAALAPHGEPPSQGQGHAPARWAWTAGRS